MYSRRDAATFQITVPDSLSPTVSASSSTTTVTTPEANTTVSAKATDDDDGRRLGDFRVSLKGSLERAKGYNWVIAATFVASEMIGTGIISLPTAINRTTMEAGLPLLIVLACMATYSAILIGKAWVIMLEMYPEYRTHCRKPYAEMGFRAIGPKMKTIVSALLNATQFGASVCFLLLISRNVSNVIKSITESEVSYCVVILIVAVLIAPIFMCKSPNDFWQVVALGAVCTLAAVALIVWGAIRDVECKSVLAPPETNWQHFLLALGTILFTVGGHAAFPTIVHDMRRPADFHKSCALAFSTLVFVNVLVVVFSITTYGSSLHTTVIESIQTQWIQYAVSMLIVGHCIFTLTMVVNPINQELEEFFNVSHNFSAKRVLVRASILLALVFVAESIPSFDKILNFLGASLLTVTSLVFPPIFYAFIAAKKSRHVARRAAQYAASPRALSAAAAAVKEKAWTMEEAYGSEDLEDYEDSISVSEVIAHTNRLTLTICIVICVTGIALGTVATVTSTTDIFAIGSLNNLPCYVAPFVGGDGGRPHVAETLVTRCCGRIQSLALHATTKCAKPKFDTYNSTIFPTF